MASACWALPGFSGWPQIALLLSNAAASTFPSGVTQASPHRGAGCHVLPAPPSSEPPLETPNSPFPGPFLGGCLCEKVPGLR